MTPCFDEVRGNIGSLIGGLRGGVQSDWDLRFDFVSYSASEAGGKKLLFRMRSLRAAGTELFRNLYSQQSNPDKFFTRDVEEFREGLQRLKAHNDEASFVALDTALDFPWREANVAHRVVILLTDEALETGLCLSQQVELIPALIDKIHQLRVLVHLIGPPSAAFDRLSAADKSEYLVVDPPKRGLVNVNFAKTLGAIGKSISASTLQAPARPSGVRRALFGQDSWTTGDAPILND